ncbi:hypothetical protein CERZMDRAFT_99319 [Cercospora zeae-maydis SCOH1-5]|uniref:Uncharacterized protein n=1 Tax=Cercospora zeae-maydis SCOH1-5 TaxID=717836 RepID=A0A6A6FB89_9PEZI|nr:hypothetical protein CERZMDRAFT_99319 [Cercospora zeae-maydis SCOH1-5]
MPHRGGATTPQPERVDSPLPSAARDALQSTLDNTLTLNRKKSWFGSAREVFQRGAKGVVGHLRSGDRKSNQEDDQENVGPDLQNEDEENSSGPASLGESHSSLTPLRPTRADRQKTFTPKSAMNSLRQHIHASGKDKGKRAALSDISSNGVSATRPSDRTSTENGEAPTVAQREVNSPTKQHGRTSSVARSVIGSLRGLSRRSTVSKPTSPASNDGSPTKRAAAIPLPSSPVDVPAPTLKLNLRDSPSLSTGLLYGPPMIDQNSELMAITNPVSQASMRVPTYYTRLPGEGPKDAIAADKADNKQGPVAVSEFLQLPVDGFEFSTPEGPSTPMPGTGAQLELDGINDIFDEPPLFERSVEARDTPEKRGNKTLKKMISLDALAEQHLRESPRRGIRLTPSSATHKVRNVSNTISIKKDHLPLASQLAALSTPSAGHRDPSTGQWKSEDPFAPGNAVGELARTPAASVGSEQKSSATPGAAILSKKCDGGTAAHISPFEQRAASEADIEPLSDNPLLRQSAAQMIAAKATSGDATLADAVETTEKVRPGLKSQTSSRLSSPQFDQFHPEHFLGLEDCERGDPPPSMVGSVDDKSATERYKSENDQPSTAPLYQRVALSQTPSPSRLSAGLSRSSDIGELFWKFSVQDWMQKGSHAAIPNSDPSPRQGSSATSIDFVSEHRVTPPDNPTVTSPGPSPNMGDRLSLDLKRSDRNMRYNALTEMSNESSVDHEDNAKRPTSTLPATLQPFRLLQGADAEEAVARDHSFPTFESVFPPSAKSSPSKKRSSKRYPDCDPSSDSIESGLQEAITDHYVFQSALAGVDFVESPLVDHSATCQVEEGFGEKTSDHASEAGCETAELKAAPQPHDTRASPRGSSPSRVGECSTKDDRRADDEDSNGQDLSEAQDDFLADASATAQSDTDTLDDCLHLYKSYEACQGHFPEEAPSSDAEHHQIFASSPPQHKVAAGNATAKGPAATAMPKNTSWSQQSESSPGRLA